MTEIDLKIQLYLYHVPVHVITEDILSNLLDSIDRIYTALLILLTPLPPSSSMFVCMCVLSD